MMKHTRRELRGLGIVFKGGQIRRVTDGSFVAKSSSGVRPYDLRWTGHLWICSCPDFVKHNDLCKHLHALRFSLALPFIIATNSGLIAGEEVSDSNACFVIDGRPVRVHDALELHRRILGELERQGSPFSRKLARPRTPRNKYAEVGGTAL